MKIEIRCLIKEGTKLSTDGNEYLQSQILTADQIEEFSKEMVSCFGDYKQQNFLWDWEVEPWKNYHQKQEDVYRVYVRRNTYNNNTIVCDFLDGRAGWIKDKVIPFTLVFSNNVVKNSGCSHPNARSVFIGPMIGNINYCPSCKKEVK